MFFLTYKKNQFIIFKEIIFIKKISNFAAAIAAGKCVAGCVRFSDSQSRQYVCGRCGRLTREFAADVAAGKFAIFFIFRTFSLLLAVFLRPLN
jgi:hypothetical protein